MHVRGLALVGRHAVGGEALDVLDRAHAFAHGQPDVLGGDVVLEIDEGLDRRVGAGAWSPRRPCRRPSSRDVSALSLALLPDLPPASFAAFSPAASASAIVSARPSVPLRGADRDAVLRILAGQEALASHRRRRPCRATARTCAPTASSRPTSGCASTGMVRSGPPPLACTVIDDTRSLPPARMTARPWLISMPSARASSTAGPVGLSRRSTIAATSTPAFFRSIAAA